MAQDFTRCISALNKAAGRELDPDEIQAAFEKLQKTARELKAGTVERGRMVPKSIRDGADKATRSSMNSLFMEAAQIEAIKMIEDANLKAERLVADAQTTAARRAEIGTMKAAGLGDVDAVRRLLVNDADGKANQFSLESRALGVSQILKSKITDTWAAMDRTFMEYFQRKDRIELLLREIKGEDTGDALAKKGAAAWLKMAEESRQWFNEKGGKVGHLDDWGLPQHHSQELVARAGRDTWVADVLPKLARDKYTDLAGNPMTDVELVKFLGNAWDSIATNGANKIEPGKHKGTGARANRHAEERQVHFKDASAVIDYWGKYGERTFPDILMGHVESMAKDIAFVEHFGSNPNAMFGMLRDGAEKAAKEAAPTKLDKIDSQLAKLDQVYEYAAGITKPVANRAIAGAFDIAKNLNVAGKLGSAAWSSLIGDKVMFEAMGHLNNLPAFQRWHNEIRLLNPLNRGERRQLRRQAMMLDYMTQAMYRFGDELGKSSLTGKLANGVMKVSGMSAVNEWRRGAWALTAMDTLGHVVSTKTFDQIGPQDMRLLQSYGVTPHDWSVWKLAKLDDLGHGNDTALTPESIGRISDAELTAAGIAGDPATVRRDAQLKLMGALTSESHLGVLEPGWSQRASMYGGLQRGNLRDELTRSFWQFKAFPIAQFQTMMDIGMSRPTTGGKISFLTMLPVMQTLAGGMLIQVQELLGGKDPRPMDDWKFWLAAFLKGGSLGLYGDFVFSQAGTTRYGTGPLEALAGPTIGAAADIATFLAQAPGKVAEGKDAQVGAKSVNILKGFIPGQNLWYTKAATDHLIFQNAQEALNPGYLDSMRARTNREFGNDWWWAPGDALPDRAPDLGNAFASH